MNRIVSEVVSPVMRETEGEHSCARSRVSWIPFVGSIAGFPDSSLDRFDI